MVDTITNNHNTLVMYDMKYFIYYLLTILSYCQMYWCFEFMLHFSDLMVVETFLRLSSWPVWPHMSKTLMSSLMKSNPTTFNRAVMCKAIMFTYGFNYIF